MDTRLLKMFCAVAKRGSLVAAAKHLNLTPSALSHGVRALETELGCRLFDRAGRKMLLNQAGEQLLAEVQPPLAALDAAGESLKRLGKWGQTRLRIGAASSACQHIVPAVIRELKKDFASVTLQVESGDMAEMEELVLQGRVDLALGVAPEGGGGLEMRTVFRDELMFVFAPSHPWADGRPISHDDLRRQPLILYQRASYTARQVDDFFRSQNITPSAVLEIGNIEAIKELVKLNLGVSVLAPWTADKELVRRKLLMRPLGLRPVRREWVVAHRAGRRLTLAEETFCRLCRQVAAGLRMDRRDLPPLKV